MSHKRTVCDTWLRQRVVLLAAQDVEMQGVEQLGNGGDLVRLPSTSRCRDARNTRYQAARYALPRQDVHPLDRASFAWRTVSGLRVRTGPQPRSFFPSAAPSPGVTGPAGAAGL
jgi:hypothetical protein